MKFIKLIAAAAISAAFIAPASAATMGMADLTINRLLIVDANNVVVSSGINIQKESRTGTATAQFNGVDATGAGPQTKISNAVGGTVDVAYRCGGPACGPAMLPGGTENNFTYHVPAPAGSFALSDMYLSGNALNQGAQGLTRADSSVAGPGNEATANSTIANAATSLTQFTVASTLQAKFVVDYNAYVAAVVNAMAGVTGSTLATINWALTLEEVVGNVSTTLLTWSPSEIQRGLTSNNASQNSTYASIGTTESALVTLTSGRTYKLAINQASNSTATEVLAVPEPGSMLLVAMGLFALGAASRRRNK